jgi:hypothetical protein
MTPSPPSNAVVSVTLPGIGVSLGYSTVAGLWQEQSAILAHWQPGRPAPRSMPWRTRTLPTTTWREKTDAF